MRPPSNSSDAKSVMVLVGTRPEGIKMAPVIRALQASALRPIVVNTGQHREMLDQVLDLFGISADVELRVMTPNQTLAGVTARLIEKIDAALLQFEPSAVLVQGDTTTVLTGALAAFYRKIPVGHVEAGLRSGDLNAPFPEEANRVLASRLATYHFAPTDGARRSLLTEGVADADILVTGNTVIDALQLEVERQRSPDVARQLRETLAEFLHDGWDAGGYVLVTGHRRENFGGGFEAICDALVELAGRFPTTRFVYPVHLNPNVKEVVHTRLGDVPNISLIPPQPYAEFVALLQGCQIVLTDSGGVQEEAPGLGKPVLVMREKTERPEGVDAGTVRLVGTDRGKIVEHATRLLSDSATYEAMAEARNPYGDGHAAERIVRHLEQALLGEAAR